MRNILVTTAMALALATPLAAQTANDAFTTESASGDHYGSELIGKRLYVSEVEIEDDWNDDALAEWDDVGEINDLLIGEDGEVKAVLLDIGGFLGIGEKRVAVNMSELRFVSEDGDRDDYFIVLQGDPAMLETAPEFSTAAMDGDMTDAAQTGEMPEADEAAKVDPENAETGLMTEEEIMSDEAKAEEPMGEERLEEERMVDANRTMWTAPELDGDYKYVEQGELTAEMLDGARVYGPDQEDVGEISNLVLSEDGKIDKAVVDVGGFLGIGEHRIAIDFDEVRVVRDAEYGGVQVHVGATKEQLEERPEYEG